MTMVLINLAGMAWAGIDPVSAKKMGKLAPRHPAADFTLKRFDTGHPIKLSDYQGKVIVLNFFTTWCGPCLKETPGFVNVYDEYKDKDVVFLSVDTGERSKDPQAVISAFVKRYGVHWPILLDEAPGSVYIAYGVKGIPMNVVINKKGDITYCRSGYLSEEKLKTELNRALGLRGVEQSVREAPASRVK